MKPLPPDTQRQLLTMRFPDAMRGTGAPCARIVEGGTLRPGDAVARVEACA